MAYSHGAFATLEEGGWGNCGKSRSGLFSFPIGLQKDRTRGLLAFGRKCLPGRILMWSSLESATSKALESLGAPAGTDSDADLETPAGISRAQLLANAADLLAPHGIWAWSGILDIPHAGSQAVRTSLARHSAGRTTMRFAAGTQVACCAVAGAGNLNRAWQEWSAIVEAPEGTMRHRLACLEQCRNVLRAILQLSNLVSETEKALGETKGSPKAPTDTGWGQELLGNAKVAVALLDVRDATGGSLRHRR